MTRASWRQWALWAAVLVVATLLLLSARARLDKAHIALVYLLVVLGASSAGGRAIGLAVAGGAFMAFNYLFLPPYYTLAIADPFDWLVLFAFLITSVVAAQLLYRARATTEIALARAQEVDRLATLGAETMAAASARDALLAIANVMRSALGADSVELYQRDDTERIERTTVAHHEGAQLPQPLSTWFGARVRSAIVLSDGTTRMDPPTLVGLEMQTMSVMLSVRHRNVGVIRLLFATPRALTSDRARLLDALSYYAALGIERVRLEDSAEQAESERRVESLRSALLMAVSHDLRTPLTTIKALAHELVASTGTNGARIIEAEADQLDLMVGDLLDLSRIQAGAIQPVSAINTVDELIGAALQRAHGAIGNRAVAVSLPEELLIARFDLTQSLRVLVNLLENALKYSPAVSGVEVSARRDGDAILIEVANEGPGIETADATRIFEPFYRRAGTPPDVRGTGLGLSIARALAEAQGGALRYRPRDGGGSVFTFALPRAEPPTA